MGAGHEQAAGLAWRKSQDLLSSFDLNCFETHSDRMLAEVATSKLVRVS